MCDMDCEIKHKLNKNIEKSNLLQTVLIIITKLYDRKSLVCISANFYHCNRVIKKRFAQKIIK